MSSKLMTKLTRLGLLSASLVAVAGPAVLVGTATPATAAASCGRTAPDLDGSSWPRQTAGVSANMRSGSSTNCDVKGWVEPGDVLDYHCYTVNLNGSTWTYLRNDSDHPDTYGWVSDSLLPRNGSGVHCGF